MGQLFVKSKAYGHRSQRVFLATGLTATLPFCELMGKQQRQLLNLAG